MKHSTIHCCVAAASFATALGSAAATDAGAAHYAQQQRWDLGAASRWDYLDIDPVRQRLFVTRGDRVQVLDLASGRPVGEIANTAGVHGIAFAQDLKLGFTSNGRANTVTLFDLGTLQTRAELKVPGQNPDAILYEPASHKLYTFNGKSGDVSVFDAVTLKLLTTIPVGGKPEFAVADGAGHVFFNIEDSAELAQIDVRMDKLVARWPLKNCTDPTGLALDAPHGRLFSVCANKTMTVTDSATGKQVATVAIGEHPDAAVFDPGTATAFSSNGDGTLSVVRQLDPDHYSAAETVTTARGARTMAFDHASGRIYLPAIVNENFNVITVGR